MESLPHSIFTVFWFLLPAGIANMAPVIFSKLPILNIPVDFGKKLWGNPIFGPHKTYRGLVSGTLCAIGFVYLQRYLFPVPNGYTIVNYQTINVTELGFALGFGALFGDLAKSFVKRRFNIPSGWIWAPFDQIDWILGALVFASFSTSIKTSYWLIALIMFGLLHPIVNLVGYFLKLKPNKY